MTAATYPRPPYTPPSQANVPVVVTDETTQFQRMGYNVLIVFLFLAFSRIFDVKFGSLHLTGISYRVVFAMALLSGGFLVALKTPIGKMLLGFTICMGLSVPFSVWRGGSRDIFQHSWLMFSFVAFLAVAGLTGNYKQWSKVYKTLAYALMTFTIIANVFGSSANGRLVLTQGKFSNPNEMAQALLLGLPLWGGMMVLAKSGPGKVFAAGVMMMMLATAFRTGSRGALVAFVAMAMLVFLRAEMADKLKIALAGVLFLGLVMTTMSGRLVARYKSVADDADTEEMGAEMAHSATSSTQSRKQLLKHSLIFTMRHPLFGVGVGMFAVADDNYMKSLGATKGTWLGTHNSYTQVSSEIGIPGFLFFIGAVWLSMKGPYAVYKKTRGDPRLAAIGTLALACHYSMIIFAVTVLFEHIAYTIMLPVFGGLAAALVRTAEMEIRRIQATPGVSMSPAAFHDYLSTRSRRG